MIIPHNRLGASEKRPAAGDNTPVEIHHIALRVADCLRSTRFYEGVLGLPEVRRQDEDGTVRSIWLQAGEAVLMVERSLRGGAESTGSGHLLCFGVQDLAEWEARLREHGIPIDDRTANTLYVRDPDGHRVGLSVFQL